jgi:uncharacterized membrane protein YcaP (DUF421 family)
MEPHALVVRALFSYVALLALLRAAHKRALAEATAFDFVLVLILGDLIDDVLWGEVGAAQFVTAAGALMLCEAVASLAGFRSRWAWRLATSPPRVMMRRGTVDREALRAEQVSEGELAEMLRLEGLPPERWADVEEMRLESGGEPSVLWRAAARPLRKADLESP